jgi:hypothetical protein
MLRCNPCEAPARPTELRTPPASRRINMRVPNTLNSAMPGVSRGLSRGRREVGSGAGGHVVGTPELATDEQMQTLRACKTCIQTRGESSRDASYGVNESRTGGLCPTCNQAMPLTGNCDNCAY